MEQEESEQYSLKEAISFKKDKHRVEIRKKNIKNTLKSKRVNHYNLGQQILQNQTNDPQIHQMKIDQHIENGLDGEKGQEITLEFYIETINQICDSGNYGANSDKILRCLKVLRSHILFAIKYTDLDEQDKQLIHFMRSSGCECILQFFAEKYDEIPILQAEAISIIGNIFSLTDKPILSFLIQSGVVAFVMNILTRLTYLVIAKTQEVNQLLEMKDKSIQANEQDIKIQEQLNIEIDQQRIRNEVLSEIFRTLANMAGESYEYRIELVSNGLIRYFTSDAFNSLCQQMNKSYIEQILFLIKNMINESPCISEEYTEQFIPILTAFFLQPDLSLEAIQDGILAIRSYAKYGNTITRAKMLSNRDVFMKIHDLIDYSKNKDYANVYYSLQTLKDYVKYSDRQAEFVFNLNGDQIFTNLEFFLSEQFQGNSHSKDEAQKQIIDLQILIIDIVHLYIICEDSEFFCSVYEKGLDIIKQILHIATFHPNNRINYKAKDFLFSCITKATQEQQQHLVQLDILQPIIDAIQEDELSLVAKGLRAIIHLLQVAESQVGQSPDFAQNNKVKDLLEYKYQLKQVFESLQAHPNNDISEQAIYIVEVYFQN